MHNLHLVAAEDGYLERISLFFFHFIYILSSSKHPEHLHLPAPLQLREISGLSFQTF